MKKTLAVVIVAAVAGVGCSGEFFFDPTDKARQSTLGNTDDVMFAISPEEGLLSHGDESVARGHARDIADVGARVIRLQFCDWVQDTGAIDAGQLDRLHRMIGIAKDEGLKIYAELNYCSVVPSGFGIQQWHGILNAGGEATVASQRAWHGGFEDSAQGNDYARAFAEATRAFAQEFGDDVDYWEIWNEPNAAPDTNWDDACTSTRYGVSGGGINWSMCPKQLGVVTMKAFEVLAEEDPQGRVVAGNVLFHGDDYWVAKDYWQAVYTSEAVQGFRASHGRYPWDVVGIHPYGVFAYAPAGDPGNGMREQVADVRAHMASDDSATIAITEYGWTTNLDHGDTRVVASELAQAFQIRDLYPIASQIGLEFVMWFNMRDALGGGYYFGIQRADGSFKPAGPAFCEVSDAASCPAGNVPGRPGALGRVGSREDGVTDPAIAACHNRNGGNGMPLENGGGPHVHRWGQGWVQDFRDPALGDTICMRADGGTDAKMVRGAIRDAYFGSGGGAGPLGYPLDEEHDVGAGPQQTFQYGYIEWAHDLGAFVPFDSGGNRL